MNPEVVLTKTKYQQMTAFFLILVLYETSYNGLFVKVGHSSVPLKFPPLEFQALGITPSVMPLKFPG